MSRKLSRYSGPMYESAYKIKMPIQRSPNPSSRASKQQQPLRLKGGSDEGNPSHRLNKRLKKINPPPSPQKRVCNKCQMEEFNIQVPGAPEICAKCHRVVTYHVFRCCQCGLQPHYPGPPMQNYLPDMGQYESDDEEYDYRDFVKK